MEKLNNYFAGINGQLESDSGEPLTTNMVILGIIVSLAVGLLILLGGSLQERGDDITDDIADTEKAWDKVQPGA